MAARKPAAGKPAAAAVPANAFNGEMSIELEGVGYVLRPTFTAIGEIETACDKSLWDLARAAEARTLTLADVGIIISACIRSHAKAEGVTHLTAVRPERIAELVYGEPGGMFLAVQAVVTPLLRDALMGAYTSSGFRRTGETTT